MRRAAAGASAGLACLLLLAGCVLPDGIDGDLTGGWDPMPDPSIWRPAAGTCHTHEYQETVALPEHDPVNCDQAHTLQTAHVADLVGEVADRVSPPEVGSTAWKSMFPQCDEGVEDYLGAHYRHSWLRIGMVVPSEEAWQGGARWVRCDVYDQFGDDLAGSLAGALVPGSDLVLACHIWEEVDGRRTNTAVDSCSEPHNSEFMDVIQVEHPNRPDVYPIDLSDAEQDPYFDACVDVLAEFVDIPRDDLGRRGINVLNDYGPRADWEDHGNRAIRCFVLLLDDETTTESLRGVGTSGLPRVD